MMPPKMLAVVAGSTFASFRHSIGRSRSRRTARPSWIGDGETVSGTFIGTVQLLSGKFANLEKSHEFTLVPWHPVIDRQLGREVMGVMQGGSVRGSSVERRDWGCSWLPDTYLCSSPRFRSSY